MSNTKFIVTKDDAIANKMMEYKFKLISAVAGVYTFVNESKNALFFESLDMSKIHFTNKLSL